jgi:hypothetical protein
MRNTGGMQRTVCVYTVYTVPGEQDLCLRHTLATQHLIWVECVSMAIVSYWIILSGHAGYTHPLYFRTYKKNLTSQKIN